MKLNASKYINMHKLLLMNWHRAPPTIHNTQTMPQAVYAYSCFQYILYLPSGHTKPTLEQTAKSRMEGQSKYNPKSNPQKNKTEMGMTGLVENTTLAVLTLS